MSKEGGKRSASRVQKPQRTQQQIGIPKKKNDEIAKEKSDSSAAQGKRHGKVSPTSPTAEIPCGLTAHRKLSDASNISEDLSKDSGCLSAKLSSSDSDTELSWIDGRAYESPDSEGKEETEAQVEAPRTGLFLSPGGYVELIMGETSEDLSREVEDLKSENEYLKDELEELRCEMLEVRDMFQEEEVFQLQQLRLQLDQANKTCRILQYRLRKAERRSIRVAQTGQVDGELVRSLEHDIKIAKSVSLRLYNELEVVQKKNSQLEWENEVLREKTQELEVAKQVLQAEAERAREGPVKKKSTRSSSRAEKRLSQIEDDSTDLRCQLHFAKEELALMCKKLTKLVSDNEGMQDELTKYRSAFGDVHNALLPDGQRNSARAREAEVKSHLKLVEEEATLLSRRIVELEMENRGLRSEMNDLREKIGSCAEDDEVEEAEPEHDREMQIARNRELDENSKMHNTTESISEGKISTCDITREGPVGGEWDPSDGHEGGDNKNQESGFKLQSRNNCETLVALRDHSCILSSAIQLLVMPPKNWHRSSPTSVTEEDLKKTQCLSPGPLNEALELFQTMLLAFIRRVEAVLIGEEGHVWRPTALAFPTGESAGDVQQSPSKQECVEDLRTTEVKERARQSKQADLGQPDPAHHCRDPKKQQCLQILWLLHQWCQEENETTCQTTLELSGLLRDVAAQLRDEPMSFESKSKAMRGTAAELDIGSVFYSEPPPVSSRTHVSKGVRRYLSQYNKKIKNWCYTSQEAAQLDREDPVKTWDHILMPPSFPDLDFQQMDFERSHTAPEKTSVRIYYSPPSQRRMQTAQLKPSPPRERESVTSTSAWFTPPSSFSALALDSNLSDDMKEITASWRHPQEKCVITSCSGTQTQTRPQMVSVALQTDSTQGPAPTRSPSRVLSSPLCERPALLSSSPINGVTGRLERHKAPSTSPKLRRHSSSLPYSSSSTLSSSSSSFSRDRALWSLSQQNHNGVTWTRQPSQRAAVGQNHGSVNGEQPERKPLAKTPASNKCGLVTEFLRRVSGRAERPAQSPGHKSKIRAMKTLERVPTGRPSGAPPLQRNDSVTRIVNQRFMKQREERATGLGQGLRSNPVPGEDSNYECGSGGSLSFCFSRPSRSNQRTAPNQSKVQPRRLTPPHPSCA